MSISWSFFKKTADNACPALTTEYMDTTAQQIYISENGRIVSTYGQIDAGNWEGAVFGENTDIGGADSAMFRATHEYNGEIWASCGNQILRYKYIQDISDLIISADTADTSDSPIRDISVSLRRPDEGMIDDYTTLFCVGGKITVDLMMGDSAKERIITAYCDEHDWSQTDNAMTVRARNAIGYFLSDATFDERTKYTGTRKGILYQMLEYSGIPLYTLIIENDTTEVEYEFKYNDRKFDKIKSLLTEWGWKIAELPDGKVLIGSQTLFNTYAPKGTHTYDKNTQGFEYHIVQRVDSSYSRIAVVSASEETNGEPIIEYRDLSTFRGWGLPKKTKYIDTLAGTPREIVAALADEYKKAYDNIGVTAEIRCPIRPSAAPGDLAVFANADVYSYIPQGIITSVRHTYGISGIMTHLTIDSGGTVIVGADGRVSTYTAADVDGDTRRREMLDEINRSANSTVIAYSNLSESGGGKETDPTVPSWAKQPEKPTYTASEVGADSAGSADSALTAAKKYTNEKVKTNVPENAVFTDTVYDDTEIKSALGNEETARANADTALQNNINSEASARSTADNELEESLNNHMGDTDNPHSVTKAQVGLGNVDNTSDANKPISTAVQNALNGKLDKSGGTMDTGATIKCLFSSDDRSTEYDIRAIHNIATNSYWATESMIYITQNAAKTDFGGFGAYGEPNNLDYFYVGTWNDCLLKIMQANGKIYFKNSNGYTALDSITANLNKSLHSASSTPYDTGRVWVDGNTIFRVDFSIKVNDIGKYVAGKIPIRLINDVLQSIIIINSNVTTRNNGSASIYGDLGDYNISFEPATGYAEFVGFIEYIDTDTTTYTVTID